jgi:copper chaperone CopZ
MKQIFRVVDMHCPSCVMCVESLEDELGGVKRITASYQKQQMQVEYDETQVTVEQIIQAVMKKGYTAIMV